MRPARYMTNSERRGKERKGQKHVGGIYPANIITINAVYVRLA